MKKLYLLIGLLVIVLVNGSFTNAPGYEKLIRDYYRAYELKDWSLLSSLLSSGFTFSSPNDDRINLATYRKRCWPNCKNTKKFDIDKLVIGKDEAFVTYNGFTNDGRVFRNTEYFKFKNGRVTENDCFFGRGVNYPNSKKK